MNGNKVQQVRDLIMPAIKANRFATIVFTKKDGSLREMLLARSKALEAGVAADPSDATQKRKWTLTERGLMTCEELTREHAYQWRTVNLNTVKKVVVDGAVHEFE
jgi:hypothetical protein